MIREIVTIDEELCNGCGQCVPACREGALQIIDNKARLVSDLMCDGLGACIGNCPVDAITFEKREAEPFNETRVIEIMISKGKNTVIAHLKHLKEHNETALLKEGVQFLKENRDRFNFSINEVISEVHNSVTHHHAGGCPGAKPMSFEPKTATIVTGNTASARSELRQWPVQLHLINPLAGYFQNADVVLAADCVAYALGNFHSAYLKGKNLAIACPKLDGRHDIYVEKIRQMIDDAYINTLHIMIMQVPCCSGLHQIAQMAAGQAGRKIPLKLTVVGIEGDIL